MSSVISGELPQRPGAPRFDGLETWPRLRAALGRAARAIRRLPAYLTGAWSRVPLERLFWIGFSILLIVFVLLLVVQPTGAGRGGR